MERSYPEWIPAKPAGVVMSQDWKRAVLGAVAGSALALSVLWPTLLGLVSSWQRNEAYQYAWLVMPVVVYLLGWHHRQATIAARPHPDYSGVVVAVAASACWSAADLMNLDVGRQFALVLAVQGIAMSALGWRSFWKLAPIFGLMFLMVPSGDIFQPVLRMLTVRIIELFAIVANLPHSVDGFVISIGKNHYVVLDGCAGLPNFLLATFLGYSFGLMLYRSIFKIAALSLFGAFIGVLSNGLRVNAIVLIDWINGSQMPLTAHKDIQWPVSIVALGLLFLVLSKLSADETAPAPEIAGEHSEERPARQFAPVFAGLSVALIGGAVIWLASYAPYQLRAAEPGSVPQDMVGWKLTSPAAVWSVDQQHHTETLALTYRRDGKDMSVLIVETTAPNAKLQESDLAPGNSSLWRENKVETQTGCAASNCLTLLHTTWEHAKTDEFRHVYSVYSIGDFTTNSKLALRAAHGWDRLTGRHRNLRLIGFTLDAATPPLTIDELAVAFRSLQSSLESGSR